jgi:hypothetical protein
MKELILKAHAIITRRKGVEYAPDFHEIQKEVDKLLKFKKK